MQNSAALCNTHRWVFLESHNARSEDNKLQLPIADSQEKIWAQREKWTWKHELKATVLVFVFAIL